MLTTSWCLYLIDMNRGERRSSFGVSLRRGRARPAAAEGQSPSALRATSLCAQTAL